MPCCGQSRKRSTAEQPILIGDPDGSLYHVRATQNVSGLMPGDSGWVTGTTVPALIAGLSLVRIP